jgi:hypothetical protein
MTTRTKALLMAAILAPLAAAQTRPTAVYKAEFTIRDSGDPYAKAPRKYSMVLNDRVKSSFRVGNRVPMATGSGAGSTQYTYVDVGVNIDCTLAEQETKVGLHADLDMSGAVISDKNPSANPTISQIRLNIDTTLAPGKPSVVASFDDPVTSRKFEVEVMLTKL